MKLSIFSLFSILLIMAACTQDNIIEKPIIFDDQRHALTLSYLEERYGISRDEPVITPQMIVVHWTQIPSFQGSFDAFNQPTLEGSRPDIASAGALNVSAHYLVDRDGTIYHLMPDTLMARHVIGLNHAAIGIENVGGTEDTPLTDAQMAANIRLIRELNNRYDIDYLIGHYEYTKFEGHELWLEKDPAYRTEKVDPGESFMRSLRQSLDDLAFKPVPNKSI